MALNPKSTLPVPMISVTSCVGKSVVCDKYNTEKHKKHTLGSFGSKRATWIPSFLKSPLA